MQCVANETTFSQYYPSKYRYPAIDYSQYEIEKSLVEINCGEDNVEERADFMSKKSPRKQQKVSFYEQRNKRRKESNIEDDKKHGVGLYRNLAVDRGVEVLNNEDGSTRHNTKRRSPNIRHRPKRQTEEPLVWNVSDK